MTDFLDVRLSPHNKSQLQIACDASVAQELSDHFTFEVPNAKFMPAVKNRLWDGKIRLFNIMARSMPAGLAFQVAKFARARGYGISIDPELAPGKFTEEQARAWIKTLGLPFEPHPHQVQSFVHAVSYKRALLLSPTSSGKSLIAYLIASWFSDDRVLLIVPTIGLVKQMENDFRDYGCEEDILCIYSGREKNSGQRIVVSTWQSIYKLPQSWFRNFRVFLGDEAHGFKSKSLTSISEKLAAADIRIGMTGTLDGTETNQLVLEGVFGATKRFISTVEMIGKGMATELQIQSLSLCYREEVRKAISKMKYQEEVAFLMSYEPRNKFVVNLVTKACPGNTLVLFNFIEHGKKLKQQIEAVTDRKVFLVYGGVQGEEREQIRKLMQKSHDVIVVASYGTFSTGINIPSLRDAIFTSPSKARIRILQSIGRILRKDEGKELATFWDLCDDASYKEKPNYALSHALERLATYNQEGFKIIYRKVNLE